MGIDCLYTVLNHFCFYSKIRGETAPQSVVRLREIRQDPDMAASLQVQNGIILDKCKVILGLLNIFLSRHPAAPVFDYLEDLHMKLEANKDLTCET